MGRPKGSGSRYLPKYCHLLIAYFERAAKAKTRKLAPVVVQQTGKTGYLKREVRQICAELPTIEGFAVSIKIPSTTVRNWARDHEEFGVAYARAKDIQRQLLVDRGLTRQYDPQAFQFVAKNITDMRDTQVLAGDPDNPVVAKCMVVDAGDDDE